MKKLLIYIIRIYQRYLSKIKRPCCRFYPTCSEYAVLAIEKYGVMRGTVKAVWRIMRCNPWGSGGINYP